MENIFLYATNYVALKGVAFYVTYISDFGGNTFFLKVKRKPHLSEVKTVFGLIR